MLHRDGPCKRQERELPDVVINIWSEFKRRYKPILVTLKAEFRKEVEHSILLDGLQSLITQIYGQNVDKMNQYPENMMTLVTSIKDTFKTDDALSSTPSFTAGVTTRGRITKLTKPVKILSWSKDMSLEIFTKQLMTWTEMNNEVPSS